MRCCPALKGKDAISGNGNSLTAYSMTDASGVASPNAKEGTTYNLASIKSPSRFVIMIETAGGGASFIKTPGDYTSRVKPLSVPGKIRHQNGAVNVILGDYSVRTMNWKEIEKNVTAYTTF